MSLKYSDHSLGKDDVARFSRQLILEGFGPFGQEKLIKAKALIIGAGGLGCPVATYLASAGIGTLGIVDHDTVDLDNLHRQFLHDESRIGMNKAKSLEQSLKKLSSSLTIFTYEVLLTPENAKEIVENYDIVADCTDNVVTRYLVNDICVFLGKPLVSGTVMGWEGQMTVYNNGPNCPCYRCIFPNAPAPEAVVNCAENGVLGPVCGIIGSLQALELIRVVIGVRSPFTGFLLMFDSTVGHPRAISLRSKLSICAICGNSPTIRELQDYVSFCRTGPTDKVYNVSLLSNDERISAQDYAKKRKGDAFPLLIDVRPSSEYDICHLPESQNIELEELQKRGINTILSRLTDNMNKLPEIIYVICRHGNDSQRAVKYLRERIAHTNFDVKFHDIIGGMDAWARDVDPDCPIY